MSRSTQPTGMRSEAMGASLMRRCDCTAPPRWLMPWTSACFTYRSFSTAAPDDETAMLTLKRFIPALFAELSPTARQACRKCGWM